MAIAVRTSTGQTSGDPRPLAESWTPVADSFRRVLGDGVHRHLYPDWSALQTRAVERVCRDEHALDRMRDAGARPAVVGTGGTGGHAPARAAYEKAGFTARPPARYHQLL